MLIEFSENCGLNAEDRELVLNWPPLHERLKMRIPSLITSRIVIRGAGIIGTADCRTIIMIDTRVFYKQGTDKGEQSYHLSIMPPSSALLLLFHDIGSNVAEQYPANADNLHLVIVRQTRWAAHDINCPEPPSGLSDPHEDVLQTAWREAREEIGEDLFDALCQNYTHRPLGPSDFVSFFSHRAPDAMISLAQEAFACVIPVTPLQLCEVRERIAKSAAAGLEGEGEKTRPDLISLREIIDEAKTGMISLTVTEFMRHFGIPIPLKAQRSELPYIKGQDFRKK